MKLTFNLKIYSVHFCPQLHLSCKFGAKKTVRKTSCSQTLCVCDHAETDGQPQTVHRMPSEIAGEDMKTIDIIDARFQVLVSIHSVAD